MTHAPILPIVFFALLAFGALAAVVGARTARELLQNAGPSHSRPGHYAIYSGIWTLVPSMLVLMAIVVFGDAAVNLLTIREFPSLFEGLAGYERTSLLEALRETQSAGSGGNASGDQVIVSAEHYVRRADQIMFIGGAIAVLGVAALGMSRARSKMLSGVSARDGVEAATKRFLFFCAAVAILTTFGILASLLGESLRFFFMLPEDWWRIWTWETRVPINDFLFGLKWSPQTALREDQVGQSGAFGLVPLLYGTLYITVIAMLVAAPIGLYSAIFLSEYASPAARAWVKPILEILAGVPTVVYGFFALLTVGPAIRVAAEFVGLDVQTQSALAAGLVMGVMIIPFVSSLSDDVINAVPQSLRDGALALGATRSEMIKNVVLPAALPGVMAALLLAISRAVGETMIVVMAAGQAANISANPLESLTTITVQITKFFTGDQAFDSAKTLSAFALGLVLFTLTLAMNVVALRIVKTYREKYE